MIIKPELVKKIKHYFDLNIYETKVWLALISKGVATAGEAAELSGVPRSRTYDVLESLEKRGFAISKIGKPVQYLAVKPQVVIEKLKNNTLKNAEEKINSLSKLKDTDEYTKLNQLHNQSISPVKREDLTASLRGKQNIYTHLKDMFENTKKEAIICTDVRDLKNKSRIFSQILEELKKSKVKMRICLKGEQELINKMNKKLGINAKKLDIPGKFFIADRNQTLFTISQNPEHEEIGIWLDSDFFSKAMANLFDIAEKNIKNKK